MEGALKVMEITKTGKTVDEAVELAIRELKVSREQVELEVLEQPKKGLLGFIGTKGATVRVIVKPDPIQKAKDYLEGIIESMGLDVQIVVNPVSERMVNFEFTGENLALLIGKRGQTLNALQYLAGLVANRFSEYKILLQLDAEGYRNRRKESLEKLATRMADKAIYTKRSVKLEPMPSFERKVIHTILQQNEKIKTASQGEEPYRHVVIIPNI